MIKVNTIVETPVILYNEDDRPMGTINSILELNDVRIRIGEAEATGYYVAFNDITIPIEKNGRMAQWPSGFFDTLDYQLNVLMELI